MTCQKCGYKSEYHFQTCPTCSWDLREGIYRDPQKASAKPSEVPSAPKPVSGQGAQKKTLGIIFSVIGIVGLIFAYTRVTSLYGQMHSWSPPFDSFEISTIIIGVVALVLLIVGIIFWSKKS